MFPTSSEKHPGNVGAACAKRLRVSPLATLGSPRAARATLQRGIFVTSFVERKEEGAEFQVPA